MSHRTHWGVSLLTAVGAMFVVLVAQSQTDLGALEGDADAGAEHFLSFGCYACHGFTGETGSTGVQLNPSRFPQVAFIAYVRNPPPISGGPFAMPAYAGSSVTDQVLADIYAYLESLPSGTPPLESIGLLSDE